MSEDKDKAKKHEEPDFTDKELAEMARIWDERASQKKTKSDTTGIRSKP